MIIAIRVSPKPVLMTSTGVIIMFARIDVLGVVGAVISMLG